MKIKVRIAFVIILALIGIIVAPLSFMQLQHEDTLFTHDSVQLGANSNSTYWIDFLNQDLFHFPFSDKIVGIVGSTGTGIDFYLVEYDNWDSWKTDIERRSALSVEYLNSSQLSSQSTQGQFSFVAPHANVFIVVFMNDEYPAVNNASAHVNITLQYISLLDFCTFVAGLVMLGVAIAMAITTRRKVQLQRVHET